MVNVGSFFYADPIYPTPTPEKLKMLTNLTQIILKVLAYCLELPPNGQMEIWSHSWNLFLISVLSGILLNSTENWTCGVLEEVGRSLPLTISTSHIKKWEQEGLQATG